MFCLKTLDLIFSGTDLQIWVESHFLLGMLWGHYLVLQQIDLCIVLKVVWNFSRTISYQIFLQNNEWSFPLYCNTFIEFVFIHGSQQCDYTLNESWWWRFESLTYFKQISSSSVFNIIRQKKINVTLLVKHFLVTVREKNI